MAYVGAVGDTASEIAEAMHFSLPNNRLHEAMRALPENAIPCCVFCSIRLSALAQACYTIYLIYGNG